METIFDEVESKDRLFKIEEAFLKISMDAQIIESFPSLECIAEEYKKKVKIGYNEDTEIAFLNLYCEIHRCGSSYSETEREALDNKFGYFNHPGGISPLLKAKPYISKGSITADLGAGNGLQGLLFQYLYPHKKTVQIELSAEMIRIGRLFQNALGLNDEKIDWINDDIMNIDFGDLDFMYLYRPSKPIKEGVRLYENMQKKLNHREKPITIFSIADCLKDYLDDKYLEFYNDGHLTCFKFAG